MNITVQKYGGSSLSNVKKIKKIANKIAERVKANEKLIIVVSAMGGTTDELEDLAQQISDTPNPREMDMLVTTGEQISASLMSMALIELGIGAISLNAFQAEINTNSIHTDANIEHINSKKIKTYLQNNDVLIVTGFQGISSEGNLTTLGRGGSDTSAVALAGAFNAPCEIYSDFPGIFTTDPRSYSQAKKLKQISYDEILEMARLGANVLHPRAVEIAKKYKIPLYCAGTFSEEEGTYISAEPIEQSVVTGLSVMENQTQVTISNLPPDHKVVNQMFKFLGEKHLNIDMISIININESINLSFSYIEKQKNYFKKALDDFQENFKNCDIVHSHDHVKLSVVGLGMRKQGGVASRFFNALDSLPIKLVTTSEIKISCLLDKKYKTRALQSLAQEFNL
ncbi:MAG: aspartate kinase [Candidatus Marinimicrobia bacterium]|nr:aspartate kinase [Candidatus Neomarinimicrobiota bacterium]